MQRVDVLRTCLLCLSGDCLRLQCRPPDRISRHTDVFCGKLTRDRIGCHAALLFENTRTPRLERVVNRLHRLDHATRVSGCWRVVQRLRQMPQRVYCLHARESKHNSGVFRLPPLSDLDKLTYRVVPKGHSAMRGESAVQPLYKQQTQPISGVVEWWAPYITEAAIGRVGREGGEGRAYG